MGSTLQVYFQLQLAMMTAQELHLSINSALASNSAIAIVSGPWRLRPLAYLA